MMGLYPSKTWKSWNTEMDWITAPDERRQMIWDPNATCDLGSEPGSEKKILFAVKDINGATGNI